MKDIGIMGNIHPSVKLIALVLISFVSLAVISFLGILLSFLFFDTKLVTEMLTGNPDFMDNIQLGKYLQMLSHIGLFLVPAILIAWLAGKHPAQYLMINTKPDLRQVFIGCCLVIASFPIIGLLLEINMHLSLPEYLKPLENWIFESEESAKLVTERFLSVSTTKGLLINLFIIAVLPAFGEEFIFRGVLMKILKQWTNNAHLAVWLSAIIFSAIHIQFLGFLPRLFLGALFGYMVMYSGSLWVAIIAHFVNNAVAVIAYYFYHNKITEIQLEDINKGDSGIYLIILSILIVSILMFAYWKIGRINEEKQNKIDN
jgi:uncharacterized protein